MKLYIGIVLTLFLGIMSLGSCQNDDFLYRDVARVRMVAEYRMAVGTDSVSFSFASEPSVVKEKAVNVALVVMGLVSDYERKVNLEVVPELTTALLSTHYDYPESVVIPANADSVNFQIVIKRTEDLMNKSVSLVVKVAESADFQVGAQEWSRLKVKWSDMIEKPSNWDKLEEFFGDYSEVKFRFILENTGVAVFTYGETNGMNWSQMYNYKTMVQAALVKYNDEHPGKPLVDEKDQAVTFP